MKNISLKIFAFMCLVLMVSCSPESFTAPSQSGLPKATDIDATITVNQTTDSVTFKLNNKGENPIWYFSDGKVSTVNGCSKVFSMAGTYSVEIKVSNANGISEGSVIKQFTINNSLIDKTIYVKLAGSSSKVWVWDQNTAGHLGCGPTGSNGTDWYNAKPNEKASMNMYDNSFTFTTGGNYTFDPGAGGTVLVNVGCSIFKSYNTTGSDFIVPVSSQTATYQITMDGGNTYIVFPAKTLLGYVPNDNIYNTPKFRILTLTSSLLELVADNGTIAWHYRFIPKE
jgi:hypothetical protein